MIDINHKPTYAIIYLMPPSTQILELHMAKGDRSLYFYLSIRSQTTR